MAYMPCNFQHPVTYHRLKLFLFNVPLGRPYQHIRIRSDNMFLRCLSSNLDVFNSMVHGFDINNKQVSLWGWRIVG